MGEKVRRVWQEGERPVLVSLLTGPERGISVWFKCPHCKLAHETTGSTVIRHIQCVCGALLRLTVRAILEELEPNA